MKPKVLCAFMKYNYGDPSRGESFEYFNFYHSLKSLGYEVELFDFMSECQDYGKDRMHEKLKTQIENFKPDVTLFCLYTDQFDEKKLKDLQRLTKTVCIFHDDTWRVDFSRHWANFFTYFTTPDPFGVNKYKKIGLNHVLPFQYACNTSLYKKKDCKKIYDVSFIGGVHPNRKWLIDKAKKTGAKVLVKGYGWPGGMTSQDEMIDIFNQSKICLNLSNSTSWDMRYLLTSPKGLINRLRSPKNIEQIKARHFEIPGCGSLQLSFYVEGIEKYFHVGEEIAVFTDPDDLIRKIQILLNDDSMREEIALKGYQRTLNEHNYEKRFAKLFSELGFN